MFKSHDYSRTMKTKFLVMNILSTYNAIIGCPTLNYLHVVIWTYYMNLKFLTKASIDELKCDPWELVPHIAHLKASEP
ncbi:hypothetical protein MUK42_36732 [Musa troglodytarum]|uniref:Uncharacterized protein n=1 Tax=Musa troglodytarum TaxID=320322 RepID=A0A9E7GX94_9LILI|nr:hypothetical protein MUK42_36732 [Musa troglodytarum]